MHDREEGREARARGEEPQGLAARDARGAKVPFGVSFEEHFGAGFEFMKARREAPFGDFGHEKAKRFLMRGRGDRIGAHDGMPVDREAEAGELAGLEGPVARALERELGELGRHDALFTQNDRLHNKS